ncbi:aminoglycoside 6'-N-acetyltransferase [Peteryoungia ipomoeae]|uniref:Aminoglycoside N(6')-acetyltransferase type 1 n=1 Tax=Peteryoungia ipomoeae TaxID=1210932 RepID=A0A4V4HMC3_9HYPH|nr:aminoglycoside 6'-N-acetyltransferase [Peteryoungia ipomoeae]THV21336.1 GNAT family N-acetyltransferase [Peteryoungia ipomoeae]
MKHLVRRADVRDLEAWVELRHRLWPSLSLDGHRDEVADALTQPDRFAAFVCVSPGGVLSGFAEASLRSDHVNGCTTSPVAFLEGIFVEPEHRRFGVASALVGAVCDWAVARGVTEIASDAAADNDTSHALHAALGFEETERVVYFRKSL